MIVSDLRLLLVDADQPPLHWIATTSQLRPQSTNEGDFARPFAVPGRGTRELVIEFGHEQGWLPELGSKHRMRLEAEFHDRTKWRTLAEFDKLKAARALEELADRCEKVIEQIRKRIKGEKITDRPRPTPRSRAWPTHPAGRNRYGSSAS